MLLNTRVVLLSNPKSFSSQQIEINSNTEELSVRCSLYQEMKVCGISLAMQTSRMILASAYVLCHLSAI